MNIDGGDYLKRRAWTVFKFKEWGTWQERRGGVFDEVGDTPVHTMAV